MNLVCNICHDAINDCPACEAQAFCFRCNWCTSCAHQAYLALVDEEVDRQTDKMIEQTVSSSPILKTCKTCRFFESITLKHPWGQCRRFPPMLPYENADYSVISNESDWCGEWAKKL
jgi:hypothetical protein